MVDSLYDIIVSSFWIMDYEYRIFSDGISPQISLVPVQQLVLMS